MKLNTKTKSKYGFVGCASSAAALGLVAMAMVCPGVDGVFAADSTHEQNLTVGFEVKDAATSGDYAVKTGNLNVSFVVNPFIEISQAPGNVAVTTDSPTSTGVTKTGSTPFAVRTNNTGFDVYVTASNKLLSPANGSNPSAINPITASNTALSSFGANTWGYAVTASGTNPSTYRTINDNTKAYGTTTFSSSATNLQLNFGTKVNDTLPADTYSTTVTLSAVLSGASVASLSADAPVISGGGAVVMDDDTESSDAEQVMVENDYTAEAYSYDEYGYGYDEYGYSYEDYGYEY